MATDERPEFVPQELCPGSGKSPDRYPRFEEHKRLPCSVCGQRVPVYQRRMDHSRPEHLALAKHHRQVA